MVSQSMRFTVLQRDNFTCQYCGESSPDVPLEVDHVWAQSLGGGDTYQNLVTSCRPCNQGKRDRECERGRPGPTREEWDDEVEAVYRLATSEFDRDWRFLLVQWAEIVGHKPRLRERLRIGHVLVGRSVTRVLRAMELSAERHARAAPPDWFNDGADEDGALRQCAIDIQEVELTLQRWDREASR